jgi:hypothetical protein
VEDVNNLNPYIYQPKMLSDACKDFSVFQDPKSSFYHFVFLSMPIYRKKPFLLHSGFSVNLQGSGAHLCRRAVRPPQDKSPES